MKEEYLYKGIARKLNKRLTENTPLIEADELLFTKPKGVNFWTANINNTPCQ